MGAGGRFGGSSSSGEGQKEREEEREKAAEVHEGR
jgi:hypothetical protein